MFKSKTVFIVGAGASCEAGLPSGDALKEQIARLLDIRFDDWGSTLKSGDHQIVHALREAVRHEGGGQGDINPYLYKAWRIRDVVPTASISIDNFLDAHRGDAEMELCGKLGIVKSILDAEHVSKLKPLKDDSQGRFDLKGLKGTWYVSFLQMLTEGVRKDEVATIGDNVSIITFNYDRCIEHFLAQGLADYYDLQYTKAQEIVKTIPVFHPYGSVGALPWQDLQNSIPFGSQRADLLSISRQIKTFTEGLDDEKIIREMHNTIGAARTVIFLGFAFHPLNMELLTPGYDTSVQRIYATTLGLSNSDERVIEGDILNMLGKDDFAYFDTRPLKPSMENMNCADFFRHFFRSLSAPTDEPAESAIDRLKAQNP